MCTRQFLAAVRRCGVGLGGFGLSYGTIAHASTPNPQPLTGWWQLPDKTLVQIKQWGQEVTGATADGSQEIVGETLSGALAKLKFGGRDRMLQGCGKEAVLSGVGTIKRFTPKLIVVCGPSGVGKGTLLNRLLKEHPELFGFSVSHTTRNPRPGEVDGKDYHFATKDSVQAGVDKGDFLEYCHVHGNIYGTSKAAMDTVLSQGKICLLDIDVQGAEKVRQSGVPFVGIFIKPPSWDELEKRLRGRGTETEDKVLKRLQTARSEVAFCDSHKFFWYELVNDDLEMCYNELLRCISQATQPDGLPSIDWDVNPAPQCQVTL
eukprot:TRINITY_DN8629_c0_g1_i1.p1 TRINITY_DN8629_c0_g1~~TRINITY_DN8629_c0_g1_i1.p1  ORF type:complete len:319 (+),score=39.69 TRINITY_DN8629_c0_g1_i1:122-1078(+)